MTVAFHTLVQRLKMLHCKTVFEVCLFGSKIIFFYRHLCIERQHSTDMSSDTQCPQSRSGFIGSVREQTHASRSVDVQVCSTHFLRRRKIIFELWGDPHREAPWLHFWELEISCGCIHESYTDRSRINRWMMNVLDEFFFAYFDRFHRFWCIFCYFIMHILRAYLDDLLVFFMTIFSVF